MHARAWPEAPETRYAFVSPTASELACSVIAPDGRIVRPFAPMRDAAGRLA